MKQIEKLEELDKMPTSIIIRRLNQVIDSHNTQAGEERDWCHCGHSEQDGIHDDKYCSTSKQDPIDVDQKLQELYMLGFQFGTKNTLMDPFLVVQKREELKDSIKSAIRQ